MNRPGKHFWDNAWAENNSDGRWEHSYWKTVSTETADIIQSLSPKKHPRVLDLGCGLGRNTIAFANAGFSVTAVDISHQAISHVQAWANGQNVQIDPVISDFSTDIFSPDSFDIVLSVNVIYHGYRDHAVRAIINIRNWLRIGGIFYFTFPTLQDGDYGNGKKLADHTFEIDPGHIHYNANEEDIKSLLTGFKMLSLVKTETPWNIDKTKVTSRWQVLLEKQ